MRSLLSSKTAAKFVYNPSVYKTLCRPLVSLSSVPSFRFGSRADGSKESAAFRIVVAPNAFKECLTASEVCSAMHSGVRDAMESVPSTDWECTCVPLADGGDGSAQILTEAMGGRMADCRVLDPLGREIHAEYGVYQNKDSSLTAVIEMATASGLHLLKDSEKNPLFTSTYGTGQMLKHALDSLGSELRHVIVCIGGSATSDAGVGMAAASGVRFVFEENFQNTHKVANFITAQNIESIVEIDAESVSQLRARFEGIKLTVACDVRNPLCGEQGAARVFGPQKLGAEAVSGSEKRQRVIEALERNTVSMAELWKKCPVFEAGFVDGVLQTAGGGAAGGLGAALMVFCGGQLRSGFELFADECQLDAALRSAHLVLTAEGALDNTTATGKVPAGVASRAGRCGHRCVPALGGSVKGLGKAHSGDSAQLVPFAIADSPMTLQQSVSRASELIANTTASIVTVAFDQYSR